jgi:hypothetical protein
MKKKLLIIGLILGFNIQLFSQTTDDKRSVLEIMLTHINLEQNNHQNAQGVSELVIIRSQFLIEELNLYQFNHKVVFKDMDEITNLNISSYLDFSCVDFSNSELVHVCLQYMKNGTKKINGIYRLEKNMGEWKLIKTESFLK